MSITTANWRKDARQEFKKLIEDVFSMHFIISADLILKCCLVLFNKNIKFQVANFDSNSVNVFEENWDRVKKSIETTFALLEKWGFDDRSLKAKNAIIPIVYYLYHKGLENDILKDHIHQEEKETMRKWLCISLLKGVFGGHSDNVLSAIRRVLDANISKDEFPFEQIKAEFANSDAKSLSFSDEVIDDILKTRKNDPYCYLILALLYSHLHYDTARYHKDHLHPASKFKNLKESDFATPEKYQFYTNPENWDSVLNLQLLSGPTNESKNDESLKDWVEKENVDLKLHLIPEDVSLEFDDFEAFIAKRKELLVKTIKGIVGSNGSSTQE